MSNARERVSIMNTIVNFPRTSPLRLGACLLLLFLVGSFRPDALTVPEQELPGTPPSVSLSGESTAVPTEEFSSEPTAAEGAEAETILLIGYDEGDGNSRSDTILLCTLHRDNQQLILTSILRDLYVPIPGHGKDRINAAYAYGGRELLKQTLEENFNISIGTSLEVDFSGFEKIVDLLGGVTLELTPEEANAGTAGSLTGGTQLLNGSQALAYVRIRKLDTDGDFSRTARQRRLLEAMLSGIRSAGPLTLLSLLKQAIPLITADVSGESLLSLAKDLLPIVRGLQITGQHIPAEGTYSYETIQGKSVLVADLEAARKLLEQTRDPSLNRTQTGRNSAPAGFDFRSRDHGT